MRNAWDNAHRKYLDNLNEVLLVGNIYKSLVCKAPLFSENLTDLLRVQLVNTLSAFDHLIHEYVRVGLEKQLIGEHPPTAKTGTFTLDIDRYLKLSKL